MNRVLVTGGAGYIGSHTCKALSQAGFIPVVYDNLSTGHAYAVKWGPFVQGDLRDTQKLSETFSAFSPVAVLHFAANALVYESMQDPQKYYQNNITSSLSLLEAMKEHKVSRFVFSSTCATYGHPLNIPITEEHPQKPISPYGKSKKMVEEILDDYSKAYGLSYIALRYFNAAGADLSLEIGENHTPETHLIPTILQAALGLKEKVTVYGTDFPTLDGSAIRDYIHVEDLANAHVLALKFLLQEKKSHFINLGTGSGYSVFQIIDEIKKTTNLEIQVTLEPKREGDPAVLTAENKKAFQLLSWAPKHDLSTIIESAWNWHKLLTEKEPLLTSIIQNRKG